MIGTFRKRLRSGETLLGSMVTIPSPAVAEVLAEVGFDWLFVDGEHGPLETGDFLAILQAVGDRIACVVRVPGALEVPIKKVLDLGAEGIIVPQVNTAEEAASVVRHARYSPAGSRGVGLSRAHGYGLRFQQYLETANERIAVIVQAEHVRAVENIESIVKVEGIDAVFVGPYDLAASLGKMGRIDDPAVTAAIEHVANTCQAAGIPLGYFGVSVSSDPAVHRPRLHAHRRGRRHALPCRRSQENVGGIAMRGSHKWSSVLPLGRLLGLLLFAPAAAAVEPEGPRAFADPDRLHRVPHRLDRAAGMRTSPRCERGRRASTGRPTFHRRGVDPRAGRLDAVRRLVARRSAGDRRPRLGEPRERPMGRGAQGVPIHRRRAGCTT